MLTRDINHPHAHGHRGIRRGIKYTPERIVVVGLYDMDNAYVTSRLTKYIDPILSAGEEYRMVVITQDIRWISHFLSIPCATIIRYLDDDLIGTTAKMVKHPRWEEIERRRYLEWAIPGLEELRAQLETLA